MPSLSFDVRVNTTVRLRVNKCEGQATLIVQSAPAPNQWINDCIVALTPDKVSALIVALKATED